MFLLGGGIRRRFLRIGFVIDADFFRRLVVVRHFLDLGIVLAFRRAVRCVFGRNLLRGLGNGSSAPRGTRLMAALAALLGFARCALFFLDQRLTIRDRDLIIVGMDFAEGKEAMPVAAVIDEAGCSDGSTRVTLAR